MTFRLAFKSADEALIFNHSRVQEREIHIVSLECFSLRIKVLFSGESTESMDGEKLSQMEGGKGGMWREEGDGTYLPQQTAQLIRFAP